MKKLLFSVVALICFSLSSFAGVGSLPENNDVAEDGCWTGTVMTVTTYYTAQGFPRHTYVFSIETICADFIQ